MKRNISFGGNNSSTLEEYDDGRSFDIMAARKITQEWVNDNMRNRENEFTISIEGVSIFCGTWNLNAKKEEIPLHDWLLPKGQDVADVYAIGFQEIVDLNAMNVAIDSTKSTQRGLFWQELIKSCLSSSGVSFTLIQTRVMVGLLLCVFVQSHLVKHVKDIRSSQLGVGIMGLMGNKGAVSIRMSIYDSSVCFVCSHLAAHRENVVGRNNDFKNIMERTIFTSDDSYDEQRNELADSSIIRPRLGASKYYGQEITISDHDFIFWLGDLNYRIDDDISIDEIFVKISKNDLSYLRERDQLNIERQKGRVFQNFYEGELQFPPTYKYQPGTDEYEARPEKKKRAPAWCDRVLWRTSGNTPSSAVTQLSYRRSNLLISDHKPVSSLFRCNFRSIDSGMENKIYDDITKDLIFFENISVVPVISLSQQHLDFGEIRYHVQESRTLIITNTGTTTALWRFIPKLEDTRISKRWITVTPKYGLLFPNRSVNVEVQIKIDRWTAQAINSGKEALEDLIVLRLERAKDNYISITGDYLRSCYGVSLDELVCTTEPLRNTVLPVNIPPVGDISNTEILRQPIPKELWRLVDALWTGGALREKDLFSETANDEEVAAIREALDCGLDFPSCSPHALVEALVSFLEALPKPIVPLDSLPTAPIDDIHMASWSRRFLESLPSLHYNVFVYILSFLREVLVQADFNRSSPERLAAVCVRCLTIASELARDRTQNNDKLKKEQRLLYFEGVLEFLLKTPSL